MGRAAWRAGCHRKMPLLSISRPPTHPLLIIKETKTMCTISSLDHGICTQVYFVLFIHHRQRYLLSGSHCIFLSVSWPVLPAWRCVLFTREAIQFLTLVSRERCSKKIVSWSVGHGDVRDFQGHGFFQIPAVEFQMSV